MRIALDIRALQIDVQYRGISTYIRELLIQFLKRRRELYLIAWPELDIELDKELLSAYKVLELPRKSSWPLDKHLGYKRDGAKLKESYEEIAKNVDLFYFPSTQDLRYGFPWEDIGVPRVVMVHSLMSVTNPELIPHCDFLGRHLTRWTHSAYAQHLVDCDGIITNSQYTERSIRTVIKGQLPGIRSILLGISDDYVLPYVSQVDEYRLQRKLPPRFVLHVGGLFGNKNVEALLQATAPRCDWPFVFAGTYSEEEQRYLAGKYSSQQIIWLGYVPREELPKLYAAASVFAYPSLLEGFGLPVLEAMAVGTPVVCSNASSLPEVVGNSAVMFNPKNLSEIRNAIYMVMQDENVRMQMRTRGLERAQHLSWRRTADTTWMTFEEIAENYNKRRKKSRMTGG